MSLASFPLMYDSRKPKKEKRLYLQLASDQANMIYYGLQRGDVLLFFYYKNQHGHKVKEKVPTQIMCNLCGLSRKKPEGNS